MTKKTNYDHYKVKREKEEAIRAKAMQSLTVDQLQAIKETHKTLRHVLSMIADCNDIYLSDVGKLDDAFWSIQNQFNLYN